MKCKKCNVNLAPYLDKCPLCNQRVTKTSDNHTYNNEIETFSTRINIIYFSRLIMKILLLSNIICLLLNIIINHKVSWSLYVIFSTLYIFSFYLYIVMNNKKLSFSLNMFSLELLLFMIAYLSNTLSWFTCLVGPFILIIVCFVLLNIYLSNYKNILRNFSVILVYLSFVLNLINGLIILYKTNIFDITWSKYSSIPLLIISIILMILSFNKKISEEIEKRFFI